MPRSLPVSEVFQSIQGEGILAGVPTVFVRFAGCNSACTFCDTKDMLRKSKSRGWRGLVKEVRALLGDSITDICLTGGEPMLVQGFDTLRSFVHSFPWVRLSIETNGTIYPNSFLRNSVDLWVISPKLSSAKAGKEPDKFAMKLFSEFASEYNDAFFKFVVSSDADEQEILELIVRHVIPKKNVILVPAHHPMKFGEYLYEPKRVYDICIRNGFRMSLQMHKLIGGGVR
jgi:7-carboxy-7-deazaguanine synthase